ncbi:TrkA C-terminal domain-containing protein [Fodinibius halophilus]|uniref:RCK C-terminal domain-containing protein n=1 Tax=Fodinibius halophilus TaxID=1736908 RepID=A0A6M1T5L1_9BACT|nr:TrkA C-terminal domain-containing protein [Fodinibius halophilus]NGP87271.1 hypothetical protein [Fodinibius halophilus]
MEIAYPIKEYHDKKIGDIPIDRDCHIEIIKRNGGLIVPHGDTVLQADDRLTIVGKKEAVQKTLSMFET